MYKIVGADQRVYGPVDAGTVRQWIAEGRANLHSRCQVEGTAEWKPLSAFPEFGEALAAKAAASPPPIAPLPRPRGPDAESIAREVIARGVGFRVGRSIERGWDLLRDNFWLFVGANLLIQLAVVVANTVPVGGLLLTGVLIGGLQWMFLKRLRGQPAEVADAFAGFSAVFVSLMVASILVQLLTFFGLLLCLVPGIYLLIAWKFSYLLAIDRKLDFWPAMEVSRRVITHQWWTMLGLAIVLFLINVFGALCCLVGLLITVPLSVAAIVCAYEDVFGQAQEPPTPTLQPVVPVAPAPSPAPTPEPPGPAVPMPVSVTEPEPPAQSLNAVATITALAEVPSSPVAAAEPPAEPPQRGSDSNQPATADQPAAGGTSGTAPAAPGT